MDALVTGKVARGWGAGPDEDRTWSVYFGDWVKIIDLSANGYWRERIQWDFHGRLESEATVKTVGEAGVFYFADWTHFMEFLTKYLGASDIEILRADEA